MNNYIAFVFKQKYHISYIKKVENMTLLLLLKVKSIWKRSYLNIKKDNISFEIKELRKNTILTEKPKFIACKEFS